LNAVDIRTDGGTLVVAPVGDVDLTNAHDLRTAILAALSHDNAAVIVDLSRTQYLDSAGIRILFSIARRLEERRRRLAIVAPPEAPVTRLLSIVDIESLASLHPTVEAARDELRPS
jgi:anti-anti-sigma factor